MDLGELIPLAGMLLGGVVSVGVLLLVAYKVRLDAERKRAEIASAGIDSGVQARIEELETQVERLTERADFTDKLLGSGRS